ncbi:MAG: aromatic amino acid ammonia-lyase, partial [Pseudomonadota bacterium]
MPTHSLALRVDGPARQAPAKPRLRGPAAAVAPARPVAILDGPLSLAQAAQVAEGAARIEIGPAAWARIAAAQARLAGAIADRRVVYGVTTGFGPLADRLVDPSDIERLQTNLIHHLASGVGRPLGWSAARAGALARLCSIACGYSGASDALVRLLTALLNSRFAPLTPEKGTVGASGDLTPLSHVALALMGRGGFIDAEGRAVDDARVFAELGEPPLTLAARDGLALVNGTSVMTGVAVLNHGRAERLARWGEAVTVAIAELLGGRLEAWRAEFAEARPHAGQRAAAAALRARAAGSERLDARPAATRRLDAPARAERALQDANTLRCAPQILGAAGDAIAWHGETVACELNAATDNPIFVDGAAPALHGGNFMGFHVAFASDALKNATLTLAVLAERQIARVTDERLNGGLPAFLHRGPAGLNSGLMGAQVTASALVAEMRVSAAPGSVQSISTNGANQDVVS